MRSQHSDASGRGLDRGCFCYFLDLPYGCLPSPRNYYPELSEIKQGSDFTRTARGFPGGEACFGLEAQRLEEGGGEAGGKRHRQSPDPFCEMDVPPR